MLLESGEYKRKEETVELADLVNLKAEQIQPVAAAKGVNVAFQDRTASRSDSSSRPVTAGTGFGESYKECS